MNEFALASATPTATLNKVQFSVLTLGSSGNLYRGQLGQHYSERVRTGEHHAHRHPHRAKRARRPGVRLQRQPLRGQRRSGTTVSEFAPGSTTPTATLTGLNWSRRPGVRLQRQPLRGQQRRARPRRNHGERVRTGEHHAHRHPYRAERAVALAFDSSGNLYVANGAGTTVSEFAPGSTTPTATLTGLNDPCPGVRLQRQPLRGQREAMAR